MNDLKDKSWGKVMDWPSHYDVYDFSSSKPQIKKHLYSVGKYNEVRKIYTEDSFVKDRRCIHMGIDLGAPAGTEVYSVCEATIVTLHNHNAVQDYGYTMIVKSNLSLKTPLYILYAHLAERSFDGKRIGQRLNQGDIVGYVGEESENGGWPPHLHFQLSRKPPENEQFPGVVSHEQREQALKDFPDPRIVLGPLY